MTPVVDLKDSIFHRKVFHAILQFGIEHHAALVHILVVYADRQHEVQELTVGYCLAPRHLLTSKER